MSRAAGRRSTPTPAWRRGAGLVALAAAVAAMTTGCLAIPAAPHDEASDVYPVPGRTAPDPTPSATSNPDGEVTYCGGVTVSIPDGAGVYRLAGECPEVLVSGNDLRIDASRAEVGVLNIWGDRNMFDAAWLPTVTLHGQDNRVTAADVGSLEVDGDRNTVESAERFASVAVQGNDNIIIGDAADTLIDGTGNHVGPGDG